MEPSDSLCVVGAQRNPEPCGLKRCRSLAKRCQVDPTHARLRCVEIGEGIILLDQLARVAEFGKPLLGHGKNCRFSLIHGSGSIRSSGSTPSASASLRTVV